MHRRKEQEQGAASAVTEIPIARFDLDQHMAEIEKRLLQQALQQTGGAKLKAAQLLGISFRSFRYRLLKYGLATEDELKRRKNDRAL